MLVEPYLHDVAGKGLPKPVARDGAKVFCV
jgi:hypothetical protein